MIIWELRIRKVHTDLLGAVVFCFFNLILLYPKFLEIFLLSLYLTDLPF
jgi:hypothetical protein